MNIRYFLILLPSIVSLVLAETELSSDANIFPFSFNPTSEIELNVSKIKNNIFVAYPNKNIKKITTLNERVIVSPSITKDLNFDGYVDLAIVTAVTPNGLNETYEIFLWDNEAKRLKKSGQIVNPSIEEEYLVENIFDTSVMRQCRDLFFCVTKVRYKWKENELIIQRESDS